MPMKTVIFSAFITLTLYFISTTSIVGMYSNITAKYGDRLENLGPNMNFSAEESQFANPANDLEVLF